MYYKEIREAFLLALPMILGLCSTMLFYMMDAAMIGQTGVLPLAAASFGSNLVGIPLVAGFGLNTTMHVLVGRAHGAGDSAGATHVLQVGLVIVTLYSSSVALFMSGYIDFLYWFGNPADVTELSKSYVITVGWSIVPTLMYHCMRGYAEAQNRPWLSLRILGSGLLMNLVGNWVLIYGNLGAPSLGILGAGIATLASQLYMCWALWRAIRKSGHFLIDENFWRMPAVKWLSLRNYLSIGIPAMAQTAAESCAFSYTTVMMGWLGAVPLAAHSIAMKCAALTFMVPLGMSFATSIRVSQAVGRGDVPAARRTGWSGMVFAVVYMSLSAVVFMLMRSHIAGFFIATQDPDRAAVIALSAQLLVVAALFQIFDGLQVVGVSALRGFADVKVPTVLLLISYWGISIPLGWWLAFHAHTSAVGKWLGITHPLGALGLWYGLLLALVLAAGILITRFSIIARR
ncbi:MAG: MATE family efflux transporter [Verrucomicrobiota bacterium]|nr:MATE family efflux transporter [Verrucomicrobiota bacterium]